MKKLLALLFLLPTLAFAQAATYKAKPVSVALTVTAGAYSAGYNMGGLITFTSAFQSVPGTGALANCYVTDKVIKSVPMELIFFSSNPTNTTFTDNAALNINAADLPKISGRCQLTSFSTFSANEVTGCDDRYIWMSSATGTVYAALVVRSAVTPASASDMNVKCFFVSD